MARPAHIRVDGAGDHCPQQGSARSSQVSAGLRRPVTALRRRGDSIFGSIAFMTRPSVDPLAFMAEISQRVAP
jgi:hypothetical protein